ncbi:MAG: hypothetical protein KG028_04220 [Actinobacteria bacterium]|jgi:hypothetical protein|nr:hypothetical protein [Actinomycetota bacterium]
MDPARRWQVASVVTAAASIGVGAFALQRPSSVDVEPIDLDVAIAQPGEAVALPTLPLSADTVIVAPDLLERMPTPPSPASTTSPVTTASAASIASPDEPAPTSRDAVAPASVDSPDDAARASVDPQTPDSPASAVSPDSVDSPGSVDSDD